MKKTFILLLFPFAAFSQKKDTVFRFLNEKLEVTTKEKAVYFGVSIKQKDHWQLYALYADTTPVINAFFKDKQLKTKDGSYTLYYPGNKIAVQGLYAENKKAGLWRSWYESGQLKDSGAMVNDRLINVWKTWFENGQLNVSCQYKEGSDADDKMQFFNLVPTGFTAIKDGSYSSWYANGEKEAEGNYSNNSMTGEWKWFHENGNPSTIEIYQGGKLVSMKCFDTSGRESGDFCNVAKPATVIEIGNYIDYIRENLIWPEEAVKQHI